MHVVLAHRSSLVAEVVARALVLRGVQARPGDPEDAAPGEVLVCDADLQAAADVVLARSSGSAQLLDVSSLVDVVGATAAGGVPDRRLHSSSTGDARPLPTLTPRERQVLALLADGASNRDIAASLAVTENTARTHVQNLLSKLQVSSRLAAGVLARRSGHVAFGA